MSEGILLDRVSRGTLLTEAERVTRLAEALPQIDAAVAGEEDEIALMATLACLLYETLPQTNWCGFYRRIKPELLAVGPYQGSMGCLRIPFSRGVCGQAARTRRVQWVKDVHLREDHIACDSLTRSELVIPIYDSSGCWAVLDLDSTHLGGFCAGEVRALSEAVSRWFGSEAPAMPLEG